MKGYLLIALFFLLPVSLSAQVYHGTTGLFHVPSAETDSAGTFRGGVAYLDKRFHPFICDNEPYNTFCYGIGLTAWEWLELSFTQTLVKEPKYGDSGPVGYYNQDRHINVKVRPLKEGKWWPAVAVGWDDIGNFGGGASLTSNNNFENFYGVVSKSFDVKKHRIGAHLAYRYYPSDKNSDRRGVAGGITYSPWLGEKLQGPRAWLQRPRVIVEWDGVGVNAGVDVLLWRHLFVQAALVHGRGFMGGVSYHYTIRH